MGRRILSAVCGAHPRALSAPSPRFTGAASVHPEVAGQLLVVGDELGELLLHLRAAYEAKVKRWFGRPSWLSMPTARTNAVE